MARNDPSKREIEITVLRCQLGERDAFVLLAEQWNGSVTRFLRSVVSDQDQADDLVQDTWVRVIQGLPGLSQPDRFPAWLFTIARRTLTDHLRRRYRFPLQHYIEGLDVVVELDKPESRLDHHDLLRQVLRLDTREREAIVLHYFIGYTVANVATIVEIPSGTVKSRLSRGRTQLRQLLNQETGT